MLYNFLYQCFIGIKVSLDLTTVELNKSVDIDRKISDNASNLPYLLRKYINQ